MLENKYCTLYICILLVSIALCRKYDIEQESRALYGESLKSIVERFRRTPEYLTILKDEVSELLKKLEAVSDRIVYVYSLKLYDRVLQEMGVNQTLLRTRPQDIYPRFGKPPQRPRILRQGANNSRTNMLDSYEQLRNPLTLAERNRMKELGFEYCGLAIHAMLDNMSPDDALPISTLLPNGGNQEKFPTQHHQHEITQPSPSTEPETHPQQHSTNTGRHH